MRDQAHRFCSALFSLDIGDVLSGRFVINAFRPASLHSRAVVESADKFDAGPLEWLQIDPGRQVRLLSA